VVVANLSDLSPYWSIETEENHEIPQSSFVMFTVLAKYG